MTNHNDKPPSFETDSSVYFYSNNLDPLNPWSAHKVNIWGEQFMTAEHAYHYRKFSETSPDVAALIQAAPSPWAALMIERQNKIKRRKDWDEVKVDIMTEILSAKVIQNQDVRDCLRNTGKKEIIKNSPEDSFWGCGSDGKGKNQMGKILMKLRDELIKG